MTTIQRDYYKVLQVDPEASPEVITAAFRILARRLHPDRDLTGVHEIRMAELNRAYGVLRDPATRRTYDFERAQRLNPVGPGPEPTPYVAPSVVAAPPRGTSVDGTPDGDSMINGFMTRTASIGAEPATNGMWSPGDTRLDFGRFAGWSIRDIARKDEGYLRWLARHSSGIRFRSEIAKVLKEPLEDPYAPSRPSR
jgi:curved DNA-binding protein CbpA